MLIVSDYLARARTKAYDTSRRVVAQKLDREIRERGCGRMHTNLCKTCNNVWVSKQQKLVQMKFWDGGDDDDDDDDDET